MKPNNTLLCDFYELTMANGYFELGKKDEIAYFDVFYRKVPDGGGFAIAAGLDQAIEYIKTLKFTTVAKTCEVAVNRHTAERKHL